MPRSAPRSIDLSGTARRFAASGLWRPLVSFDPVSRHYAQLAVGEGYEAWLLTWLPGQGTPWHDHGHSSGSCIVLQGKLTERVARYAGPDRPARVVDPPRILGPGDQRSFGRHYVHRVENLGIDPAVSLHVYGPRLTTMTTYDVQDDLLALVARERVAIPR